MPAVSCAAALVIAFQERIAAASPALGSETTVDGGEKAAGHLLEYAKLAVPYLLTAVGALVVFVVGRIVAGWVGRVVARGLSTRHFDPAMAKFISGLTRTLVMLGVLMGILGMFGIETTSFAAVLGTRDTKVALDAANISIPFPQVRVHMTPPAS